jgi:hypothetical protein
MPEMATSKTDSMTAPFNVTGPARTGLALALAGLPIDGFAYQLCVHRFKSCLVLLQLPPPAVLLGLLISGHHTRREVDPTQLRFRALGSSLKPFLFSHAAVHLTLSLNLHTFLGDCQFIWVWLL